jgi:hypothetical protein
MPALTASAIASYEFLIAEPFGKLVAMNVASEPALSGLPDVPVVAIMMVSILSITIFAKFSLAADRRWSQS